MVLKPSSCIGLARPPPWLAVTDKVQTLALWPPITASLMGITSGSVSGHSV